MTVVINELISDNEHIIEKILALLAKTADPETSIFFIHFDPHYRKFFKTMINNKIDRVFYCEDDEDNFLGFAHFKKLDKKVILNKIVIETKFQGLTCGKMLLISALNTIFREYNDCENFELDVFEKNQKALNWFLKLKMDISDYRNWYNVTDYFRSDIRLANSYFSIEKSFKFIQDGNGFMQLVYNNSHIGTLIDNMYLVIKTDIDYFLLNSMNSFFKKFSLETVCMVTKKEHDLFLIDKSFHLTIPFKKLKLV